MHKKKIAILQPGRIGDIIICLPIAGFYKDRGFDIQWPIDYRFVPMFKEVAPWVQWVSVSAKNGPSRVVAARNIIKSNRLESIDVQSTHGIKAMTRPNGAYISFDELKYQKAGVPFDQKWRLNDYIKLPYESCEIVYSNCVSDKKNYTITHYQGSNWTFEGDYRGRTCGYVERGVPVVNILQHIAPSIFHWWLCITRASRLVMVDSCFANLVEQMGLKNDRIFIRRSDKWRTPRLKPGWRIVKELGQHINPARQYNG